MPTLHVRNVPDELYEALRSRAEERRTSIGAEAIALLERGLRTDLAGVREVIADYGRRRPVALPGAPSGARLIREDRDREDRDRDDRDRDVRDRDERDRDERDRE